jgi:hypothetical protein
MVPYGAISSTKTKENKMTIQEKTLTHETIQFQNTDSDEMFLCFGNWFQTKDQEIGEYYTDGEISLEAIARFLVDNAEMKCCDGAHDNVLFPAGKFVEFKVTRAKFWDGDGGTNDVEVMGAIEIIKLSSGKCNVRLAFMM